MSEAGTFPPGTLASDQFTTLTAALIDWATPAAAGVQPRANAVVTILDNRTYALPGAVTLRQRGRLAIEAADGPAAAPADGNHGTAFRVEVQPPAIAGDPERQAVLTLTGVVVEGSIRVTGDLGRLRLLHSTLVPGRSPHRDRRARDDGSQPRRRRRPTANDARSTRTSLRIEVAFAITDRSSCPS